MSTISLDKSQDVPFLFGGKGTISIDTGKLDPAKALDPTTTSILDVEFKADGSKSFPLGQADTVKVGVSAAASVKLTPIFSSSGGGATLLSNNGLSDFFKDPAHGGDLILAFDAGGSADVTASGAFTYSVLKASVQIDAGANGGYTYLRALDRTLPLDELIPEFFSAMRLPEQSLKAADNSPLAPEPGEAIALRYGGKLQVSADLSAGYSLTGTKSISLGEMALSEKYDLSILGKVGVSAGVQGDFSILVTRANRDGNWTRVKVHRNGQGNFSVAADISVGFTNSLNLPSDANDFLGAVLGVNGKSIINLFAKAVDLSSFDNLKSAIDGLAQKYIGELVGKGFDELADNAEFTKLLDFAHKVVESYETAGDRAVTLFDKYFDRLSFLEGFLTKLSQLEADGIGDLRQALGSSDLWNIFSQLTDGDPLSFLLQQVTIAGVKVDSLDALKTRVNSVLELLKDGAHTEIRQAITQAKASLGLDQFFQQLAKIDTKEELQAVATRKLGDFVTRLTGRALDSSPNIKAAFDEIHAVLANINDFKDKLYASFKDALNSSYKLTLHAAYSRASATDALIDVFINMSHPGGPALLAKAGKGDFSDCVITADASLLELQEGVFTHNVKRESAFKVNIVGWHLNYDYEGFDRVITNTEQRLLPSDQGVMVLSVSDVEVERFRKRNAQTVHSDFLLRALGESRGVIAKSPKGTREYVIDALTGLSARYQLSFTDDKTSETELNDFLAFARELAMDGQGATAAQLKPFLPRAADGSFGAVTASYDVRFKEASINSLLRLSGLDNTLELILRRTMRLMLLANYLRSDALHDVAFAYATPDMYTFHKNEGGNFTNHSSLNVTVNLGSVGIAAPAKVTLTRDLGELNFLDTLYKIEDKVIQATRDLYTVLGSQDLDPAAFENKLAGFGSALDDFDNFDQTSGAHGVGSSTVFAVFNKLVQLGSMGTDTSAAMLTLSSQVGGATATKVFLTGGFADEAAPHVAAAH